VIAIAFHWGERQAHPPESGTAWEHYREILPDLAKRYQVIGHGHPLARATYRREFERVGIEWVADFRDVLRQADLYINDLSSTMYEFVATGKPVIILNAPWFRRRVSWGIRFWDYSNVGINVEDPSQLFDAIDRTFADYETICLDERRSAVRDLYPYLGRSAARAVDVLLGYLKELECTPVKATSNLT
jgi:CDP-glycerol glycerophosphotransferase (TagB/SpsB family)